MVLQRTGESKLVNRLAGSALLLVGLAMITRKNYALDILPAIAITEGLVELVTGRAYVITSKLLHYD